MPEMQDLLTALVVYLLRTKKGLKDLCKQEIRGIFIRTH